jgi:hypothetical protein
MTNTQHYVADLFAAVDALVATAFAERFTEAGAFRFGNAPAVCRPAADRRKCRRVLFHDRRSEARDRGGVVRRVGGRCGDQRRDDGDVSAQRCNGDRRHSGNQHVADAGRSHRRLSCLCGYLTRLRHGSRSRWWRGRGNHVGTSWVIRHPFRRRESRIQRAVFSAIPVRTPSSTSRSRGRNGRSIRKRRRTSVERRHGSISPHGRRCL